MPILTQDGGDLLTEDLSFALLESEGAPRSGTGLLLLQNGAGLLTQDGGVIELEDFSNPVVLLFASDSGSGRDAIDPASPVVIPVVHDAGHAADAVRSVTYQRVHRRRAVLVPKAVVLDRRVPALRMTDGDG